MYSVYLTGNHRLTSGGLVTLMPVISNPISSVPSDALLIKASATLLSSANVSLLPTETTSTPSALSGGGGGAIPKQTMVWFTSVHLSAEVVALPSLQIVPFASDNGEEHVPPAWYTQCATPQAVPSVSTPKVEAHVSCDGAAHEPCVDGVHVPPTLRQDVSDVTLAVEQVPPGWNTHHAMLLGHVVVPSAGAPQMVLAKGVQVRGRHADGAWQAGAAGQTTLRHGSLGAGSISHSSPENPPVQ
jgi:hypothetical protein